jgi:hypothetical protein
MVRIFALRDSDDFCTGDSEDSIMRVIGRISASSINREDFCTGDSNDFCICNGENSHTRDREDFYIVIVRVMISAKR